MHISQYQAHTLKFLEYFVDLLTVLCHDGFDLGRSDEYDHQKVTITFFWHKFDLKKVQLGHGLTTEPIVRRVIKYYSQQKLVFEIAFHVSHLRQFQWWCCLIFREFSFFFKPFEVIFVIINNEVYTNSTSSALQIYFRIWTPYYRYYLY